MNRLARLVGDVEAPFQNDLHLVVCVLVYQRSAFFKTIDSATDRRFGVVFFGTGDVAEVGVFVGDEGRFEFGLDVGVVGHWNH